MSDHMDSEIEMSCGELRANMDALLSGDLPRDDQVRLFNHAAFCGPCGTYLDWAREVQRLVAEAAPNEPMAEDIEERVFRAVGTDEHNPFLNSWRRGIAVAAVVLFALVLWPLTYWNHTGTMEQTASRLETWEPEVRQVRLAFSSSEPLENVRLTLELPDNVELEPFPGRHSLSWHVDLSAGDNVLTLPLRVLYPAEAELVARLDDGNRKKTFRTPIPGELVQPGAKE
ncbi:anti-sigma factor family protein [Marinobacter lacisalsi]|uniref:Anti-sigma factor family protein n=1 Tax=Marinobacter lacisalsi TaxID=475979 RepID=A0ABV8QJP3_9GAMM